MHKGDGKALPSCPYLIKYLNESLPYDFLSDNAILLISTSLILIGFLMKSAFNNPIFSKMYGFLFHFYTMKRKKKIKKIFILIFWPDSNFFDILLVFVSFLQTYYDIWFFYIFAFHFFLLRISFCIYLLLALLIVLYHFYNNGLLYLVSHLCFFDNKFLHRSCTQQPFIHS